MSWKTEQDKTNLELLNNENQQLIDLLTQSNSLQDEYQNLLNALQEN